MPRRLLEELCIAAQQCNAPREQLQNHKKTGELVAPPGTELNQLLWLEGDSDCKLRVAVVVERVAVAAFLHLGSERARSAISRAGSRPDQRADISSAEREADHVEVLVIENVEEFSARLNGHALADLEVLV